MEDFTHYVCCGGVNGSPILIKHTVSTDKRTTSCRRNPMVFVPLWFLVIHNKMVQIRKEIIEGPGAMETSDTPTDTCT